MIDLYAICKRSKTNRLKVKRWKNILHVNNNQKKSGVAILISNYTLNKKNSHKTKEDIIY